MKYSIKKVFSALVLGSLVLTTVPAKAEFRPNFYSILGKAVVAAGVAAGAYGLHWLYKQFFGPIVIKNAQDFKDKEKQLVKGTVVHLAGDFASHDLSAVGRSGEYLPSTCKVAEVTTKPGNKAVKVIVFSPIDNDNKFPFGAFIDSEHVDVKINSDHL